MFAGTLRDNLCLGPIPQADDRLMQALALFLEEEAERVSEDQIREEVHSFSQRKRLERRQAATRSGVRGDGLFVVGGLPKRPSPGKWSSTDSTVVQVESPS